MIFEHQKHAINRLKLNYAATRQAATDGISARFHSLVIGPSGSGKTHAARRITDGAFYVHAPSWVVLGAKSTPTMKHVYEYIAKTPQPLIILDELDKIFGEDSWTRYLRAELFSLLDGFFPSSLDFDDFEGDKTQSFENLKHAMFIGIGAFQSQTASEKIGFSGKRDEIQRTDLQKQIPTELINRFGDLLTITAPPTAVVIQQMNQTEILPIELALALQQVDLDDTLGVRAVEIINAQIARNRVVITTDDFEDSVLNETLTAEINELWEFLEYQHEVDK